jgi:DNA-binding NarL/FixJ family response regulator/tetratricopeptide (TPR) repeat protein
VTTVTFDRLVGRADELDILDAALDSLGRGEPAALALVGEPGIGKTRLLSELARRADERRYLVLSGSGSELESDVPFWVFVDALDEYVRGLDPALLQALDEGVRTELGHVLPAIEAGDGAGPGLQNERYRTHRAVRVLLEGLTATRPLVVILDDFHWADSGSAELLGALLHRPPAAPVLLAIGMRPRLVTERLAGAFERAHRSGILTRLDLGPLTSAEARELLGAVDDSRQATLLYEESGGNPFYLEQLARSLGRDGGEPTVGPTTPALAAVGVPSAVAASLAEELAQLTNDARALVQGAAVAGDPFEPELAAAAAGTSEQSAMNALDELLSVDLVRSTDVPRRFRFRHPLVRRAVYESAPGGWRLGAHERCAEMLAAQGAAVAARAHHVELSARHGDASAVAVLREAGEAAAKRAPATAARWFESALRLIADDAPIEERLELLLARTGSLVATGHFAESHAALLESIRLVPEDALALRVQLIAGCAGVENLLGRYVQARTRLESTLAGLDDPDSPEAVSLMIELAVAGLFQAEYEAMARWADRAIAAVAPLQNRPLTAAALAVRAAGSAMAGDGTVAERHRTEAAHLVDVLSDDELAQRLGALAYLALAEIYLDHFERAMAIGRATGQGDLVPLIVANLGTGLWVRGRVAEASDVLEGAVEAARLVGDVQGLVWTLFNWSYALFAAGDLELAVATATESRDLAGSLDSGPIAAHAYAALATSLAELGKPAEAAELLVVGAGGEELRMVGGAWRGRYLELLTRCRLADGKRAEAERAAQAARACADDVGLTLARAMAEIAQARLELAEGSAAASGARTLEAIAALEEIGDVFDAAHARLLAGVALGAAGEQDRAAQELERAAAAFASFGADRFRAQAEQELRRLGRRVHRRSAAGTADTGLGALTERELELARLVVDRKTNPEIAAELFLSQKTVETHLRNIFRKVGVANRVELARAVEQADRAETAAG